jgi:hypothetical protein
MLNKIKSAVARELSRGCEKFRGIHDGETCYIIGDGPSVKWFDLSAFSDHPAICCGFLPFHKDFKKLDVRYCTMIEPWLFAPEFMQPDLPAITEFRRVAKEYRSIIKSNPDKQFFVHYSNYLWIIRENVNTIFKELPKSKNKLIEQLRQFDCFGGSFHAALSLAYYMGFKKLYLIGFDGWTIQPAREFHWYELGEGSFYEPENLAAEYLNLLQTEVEICAIAYDGHSKNVKCISYETYTGKPPMFRENNELLSEYYLDVLATYPEYKIRD